MSEKGKEVHKLANKRYEASERGKEVSKLAMKRWYEKKKKQMKNE